MTLKLPLYFSVNDRPVKVIATPDGGADVLKLDLTTGEFVRDRQLLAAYFSGDAGVEHLTEEEFNRLVASHGPPAPSK